MIFSIIIPVYNETLNIKILVNEIHKFIKFSDFEVVIINDCSTDDTKKTIAIFK